MDAMKKEVSLNELEKSCTRATIDPYSSRTAPAMAATSTRRCCQRLIVSPLFEWSVAAVIFANAVFIGVQADWGVHHPGEELPLAFRALDKILVVVFTLELLLRIVAEGRAFFSPRSPEFQWNVFDTTLVAISYWEFLTASLGVSFIKTNFTRLLRLSRLVRAMRVIRIIRFFSELRVMVLAICSSLRLLLWAGCLLVMLMYLFAVSIVQIVETQLADEATGSTGELVLYWGSLPRAIYTLYLSITNGTSWDDAAEPLLMISPSLVAAYCVYIGIASFCVLNTITGIIVDKATHVIAADDDCRMWNELDRKKRWVRDVRLLFHKADKDGTGKLGWEGFHRLLTDLQMQNILKCLGVDVMAIEPRMLFDLFDTDGGGTIDINEFAASIQKLHGSAKAIDMARLKFKIVGMNNKIRTLLDILEPQGFDRDQERRDTVISRNVDFSIDEDLF